MGSHSDLGGHASGRLFSMMFSAMLTDASKVCDAGFPLSYRFDGKLSNRRRLQVC